MTVNMKNAKGHSNESGTREIQQRDLFSGKSIVELLYPTKDTERKYTQLAAEAAFFQILISWFRDGMREDEEYMANLCVEIFDGVLKILR